ncbi:MULTISPECIES: aminoglycoside phosphotransferase family protein [Bosea]|uniref:aminoglycoside phosphotransferase family protein n=1 Tax=Bosea TaxID=85413 RepID=UPI00215023BF|nr:MULTISPECIES: aminoglycoside phosphotransferase family protein [Bosea]MCR4524092.1 APH(6) family putative aminoglycoside O-phosphotransferase [Bosea sp. 47.2.35]MDR6827470.1 streptomycin 6-kinase [Bosea robiniae]MDR6894180.1 streptomycin 6-kinase [Bosea sp. BE109]MDR7137575.1 streptomycin 6-kinase [Bosea sp. BE168]MDR7174275.1 streptomycin 6-kinase [Bosea sp. BE271]
MSGISGDVFQPWLTRWGLVVDGEPIRTHASHLLPVLQGGAPAVLKLPEVEDERRGYLPLEYWNGDGAARLLARSENGEAMLIERATGHRSLAAMARSGDKGDDDATAVLCDAIAGLQKPRGPAPNGLIPLDTWFKDLFPAAGKHGDLLIHAAAEASALLPVQQEIMPLHADLHHDNVLDFGARGWLAIDPKSVIGDRAFEYTILFCDPDLADPQPPVAVAPGAFERRLEIVLAKSGLERKRLLRWIVAWCGLSASWFLEDDDPLATVNLAVAERALAALDAP